MNLISTQNTQAVPALSTTKRLAAGHNHSPTVVMSIVSLVLFLVFMRLGVSLLGIKPPMPQSYGPSDNPAAELITLYLAAVGSVLVIGMFTIVLHEIIHGLAAWVCGYSPKLKRGKFEYADAVYTGQLTPNQITGISLAPLFILSLVIVPLLLVPGLQFFALIALAGNAAGSLDDLRLAYSIRQPF